LLASCAPGVGTGEETFGKLADMAQGAATQSPCDVPAGTLGVDTPSSGYWDADQCRQHCLPPKQMFSVCTAGMGRLVTPGQGDFETQSYGATWETDEAGCPAYPWRVWRVVPIPYPSFAATGSQSPPSIPSDCSSLPMSVSAPLPSDRQYYVPVAEVGPPS
jgi:hypothetical protein